MTPTGAQATPTDDPLSAISRAGTAPARDLIDRKGTAPHGYERRRDEEGDDIPMSDINTTPLVDVMLVLLIIFLITIPVVIQTVPVQLAERAQRGHPDQAREHLALGPGRWRRAAAKSIGT